MNPFDFHVAHDGQAAVALAGQSAARRYLGGGTNLVDLMREDIEQPAVLIDVTGLSSAIEARADGSMLIGAAAKNSAVASDPAVRERFPMLAMALLSGASGQIRNMATVGGNLLQRTRCTYFYDGAARCNKRQPGAGCDAVEGLNRNHAILGTSPGCVATHPSDMCVALAALDAIVHVQGADGLRQLPLAELHRLPGARPDLDHVLAPGELIIAVEIPPLPFAQYSTYRKVRDRSSYAFALVSVAAAIELSGATISDVRIAIGGVAHKPWRASTAEALLRGAPATAANFRAAADAELANAIGLRDNAFKIALCKRTLAAVLASLCPAYLTGATS